MDNINNILQQKNPQQVQEIIDAENARLDAKEQSYQNMQFGKQRILQMNQNYQERTTFFNQMLFCVFITLTLTVFLIYINKLFPGFSSLITIAIIIVISVGGIIFAYLYSIFNSRKITNFDEIEYGQKIQPPTSVNQAANASLTKAPLVNQSGHVCMGPDCCHGIDVVWDAGNNVCTTDFSGSVVGNVIGNVDIGNVDIGNVAVGNVDIGNVDIGNVDIGNVVNNNYSCLGNTSLPMNIIDIPTIPKLISGQIFLGPYGRNLIQVEDSKTFIYTDIHIENKVFTSLDGVNFINSSDSTETATVVIYGPQGPMGQKINGQGVMISDSSGNTYFYFSKNPPLLLTGDVFLSDSGVVLTVVNPNEFTLQTTTTSPILRIYKAVDGVNFIDIENNTNTATIVTHGPTGVMGEQILGQAVLLGEGVYFYYNRNNNSKTDNVNTSSITLPPSYAPASTTLDTDINSGIETFEGIKPVQINQYTIYPTLKNKKNDEKYKSIQEDMPYSEYKTSSDLFSF